MTDAIAWAGTAAILASRVLLAHRRMVPGFAAAFAGSALWCVYALRMELWPLLVVDGVMCLADLYGLLRNVR